MNIFLIYLAGFMLTAIITGFIVGKNVETLDIPEIVSYLLMVFIWPIGLLMILMVSCLELGRVLRAKLWP